MDAVSKFFCGVSILGCDSSAAGTSPHDCEDVAEAFDVVLHRGEVGSVYNIGTMKERRVIDVARHICGFFGLDPGEAIWTVSNRPFNDDRYIIDDQKLKALGWSEGIEKTADWYVKHGADWWGQGWTLPLGMGMVRATARAAKASAPW